MMNKNKALLAALLVGLTVHTNAAHAAEVAVRKEVVTVPGAYYVAYQGKEKADFPQGFPTGFGSGIAFKGMLADGAMAFYVITDRGPNADGPKYQRGEQAVDGKLFPTPAFQPRIGVIRLSADGAIVTGSMGLMNQAGQALSGLPISSGKIGATNEAALDENLQLAGNDVNGLDPEGIALDRKGRFWVCDEYGPFLASFDQQGKMISRYAPGEGLPEVLRHRIPNRGFEGITVTPGGKVVAAVQSVLDIDGATAQRAQFTRLVELDPATGQTRMFAYPVDVEAYKSPREAKLGDLIALSDTRFLVIEQGKGKDGEMRNLIYEVDIEAATDLTGKRINGQELEQADPAAVNATIWFANKRLVLDLRAHGWTAEKAEGITVLPDKKTIAIVNDNDFGMAASLRDEAHAKGKIGNYVLRADGSFTYKGAAAEPVIRIVPAEADEAKVNLWLISFDKPL